MIRPTNYKRRLPTVSQPPLPSAAGRLVRASVVVRADFRRGGTVLRTMPPPVRVPAWKPRPVLVVRSDQMRRGVVIFGKPPLRPPASGKAHQPLVVRSDFRRAGQTIASRPPYQAVKPPRTPAARVTRSDFWRAGRIVWERPPQKPPPVSVPGGIARSLVIRPDVPGRSRAGMGRFAGWLSIPNTTFHPADRTFWLHARTGRAGQATLDFRAGPQTLFLRMASETMSIPSNFSFFQGEDLQLNFIMTPPQDITGWTLTGTVKDKLGGSTQFTFVPSIQDGGRGWFQASWARAQTSLLTPGDYVWDIRRTDSGKNAVLAHGEATCKQPVTA